MGIGLQTARALVIDNDFREAQAVLMALSKLRIGSVYLNGDVELLNEADRLRGIRLAFVDMDLIGDGGTPPEEFAVNAANYLASAVAPDNGMLAVLIWTKHQEVAADFLSELRGLLPESIVLHLGTMEKPPQVVDGEPEAQGDVAETIVENVSQELQSAVGLHLLWEWEQLTHDAVTSSSDHLIEVVRKEPRIELTEKDSVANGFVNAFGLLASAAREREAELGKEAASAAVLGLLPLLEDGVEQSSERVLHVEENDLARLLEIAKNPSTLRDRSTEKRERFGRLNRMVHVSRWRDDETPLLPGNVYEVDDEILESLSFDRELLFGSCSGSAYKNEEGEVEPKVIITEVSPACDYAQNKVETPRVLGGILMPIARLSKIPSDDYIYKECGVFHFDVDDVRELAPGTFHFALNARFFSGVSRRILEGRKSLFRIRRNTLVDVQAWLARYGNRPGVIRLIS